MAIADETHRGSMSVSLTATFGRLWSGTGSRGGNMADGRRRAVTRNWSALSDEQKRSGRDHVPVFTTATSATRARMTRLPRHRTKTRDAFRSDCQPAEYCGATQNRRHCHAGSQKNVTLCGHAKTTSVLQWTYPTHLERMNIQAACGLPAARRGRTVNGLSVRVPGANRGRVGHANIVKSAVQPQRGAFRLPLPTAALRHPVTPYQRERSAQQHYPDTLQSR